MFSCIVTVIQEKKHMIQHRRQRPRERAIGSTAWWAPDADVSMGLGICARCCRIATLVNLPRLTRDGMIFNYS